MSDFGNSEFTKVKDISGRRRMPRLGKIRLGAKVKKGDKEYPIELPFFLVPDEVAARYALGDTAWDRAVELGVTRADVLRFVGDNGHRLAEKIPVMLPMDNLSAVFPQAYKRYGSSRGVKCIGNGERAREMEYDDKGRPAGSKEKDCPCNFLEAERPECKLNSTLNVMLPDVNVGGIYQISLGSYNSTVDINSGIDYAKSLIGRAAMVPFELIRVPTITHGSGKKETHFTLQLRLSIPQQLLEATRKDNNRIISHTEMLMLPEPENINPEMDEPDVIEVDVEPAQEPQNTGQEDVIGPETTADSGEAGGMGLESDSVAASAAIALVESGDLGIINALLNTQKAPKDEYDRCCHVAEMLQIGIDNLPSLESLTYSDAQRLLGMLKKGGK